jgi:hypothetical protein
MSGVSRTLTPDERAARDQRIVEAASGGEPRQAIADRERLTDRQVRRILARRPAEAVVQVPDLDVPDVISVDPLRELSRAIATHRDAVDRLRAIAVRSANEAVAVGALKAAAQTARDLLGLLRESGLTPPTAFDWRNETLWSRAWAALEAVAEEHGLDAEAINAAWLRHLDRPRVGVELTGLGPADDLDRVAA